MCAAVDLLWGLVLWGASDELVLAGETLPAPRMMAALAPASPSPEDLKLGRLMVSDRCTKAIAVGVILIFQLGGD